LEGTSAAVYRELGRLLAHGREPGDEPGAAITTRFVVDVVSGSSAGGINGVFLAKALANEQSIVDLKRLWVDEGDIAVLINDADSYRGLELRQQRPPRSALNSRRMYWKLLEALDAMDGRSEAQPESRLVDELDLWITATDIRGVTVPLDLYDRFVFEKRHRKAFRFVYGTDFSRGALEPDGNKARNDFRRPQNPFLAFAARCTSAFPVAFEPMQLADIDEVVGTDTFRAQYGERRSDHPDWRPYFEEYLKPGGAETVREAGEEAAFETQSFADGGYLDNKPFTWATQTLDRRRADLPVDRRLIYVEPDPGAHQLALHAPGTQGDQREAWLRYGPLAHLDAERARERPNALENAVAALTGIPRYEPIREDLEALIARNRDLERVEQLTSIVDEARAQHWAFPPVHPPDEWRALPATQLIAERGLQFGAYHRLRVATVADDLAVLITRLAGFDEESGEYSAIRSLVQAWVARHHPDDAAGEQSQNEFLLRYDLGYRLRRIDFLQARLDRLLAAERMLEEVEAFHALKRTLNDTLTELRAFGRALRARGAQNPVRARVEALALSRDQLWELLDGARTRDESVQRAAALLAEGGLDGRLTDVATAVAFALSATFEEARRRLDDGIAAVPAGEARDELRHYFAYFDVYDSVLLPVSYGSVGEADRVEVIRISPHDAISIVDETRTPRRKLAGTAIHHFGGFFDRSWRRNDLLWGRLDAAERIITTLLPPDSPAREDLLRRAQLAIVREELVGEGREELTAALAQSLLAGAPTAPVDADRVRRALDGVRTPEELLDFLKDGYEVERRLDSPTTLKTVGRLSRVTGQVLDGVSDSAAISKPARWLTRLGRVLWGLGEISTPRSFARLLWTYWAQLLIGVAVLLVIGGAVFGSPAATKTGWILLVLIAGIKVATWVAEDLTGSGPTRHRVRRFVVAAVVLVATAATVWAAVELSRKAADRFDAAACRLPDRAAKRVEALWPWHDHTC
jgi:patatin-related protein